MPITATKSIFWHKHEMLFSDALAIYEQISNATKDLDIRSLGIQARLTSYSQASKSIKKVAFDTRRIDQENDRNPRRNLQYYHRSEPYVDDQLSVKIAYMMKIKTATDMLKEKYGTDPEWFDSYARILSSAVDRALRTDQKDGDFFKASFDYLDELLYVRYRLSTEDIQKMNENDIGRIVVSRDEAMVHKHLFKTTSMAPPAPTPDPLIERLMGTVKASGDNKSVERSVTITVKDQINDLQKTSENDKEPDKTGSK